MDEDVRVVLLAHRAILEKLISHIQLLKADVSRVLEAHQPGYRADGTIPNGEPRASMR